MHLQSLGVVGSTTATMQLCKWFPDSWAFADLDGSGDSPYAGALSEFTPLPDPPYYAVILAAQRSDRDEPGYSAMAARISELALAHPGCIGMETTRNEAGFGITVSYFRDADAVLS